jgi:hypothetical protein
MVDGQTNWTGGRFGASGHAAANLEINMDAKQVFDTFKNAKVDGSKTNADIYRQYNKLYEKARLQGKVGQVAELVAENARLKQMLEAGKSKAKAA